MAARLASQRSGIKQKENAMKHDLERGVIQDNALKAAVTSKLFKSRVEKVKKGKGSYTRKAKYKSTYQREFDKCFFDLIRFVLMWYNCIK